LLSLRYPLVPWPLLPPEGDKLAPQALSASVLPPEWTKLSISKVYVMIDPLFKPTLSMSKPS